MVKNGNVTEVAVDDSVWFGESEEVPENYDTTVIVA